eukprot:304221_1
MSTFLMLLIFLLTKLCIVSSIEYLPTVSSNTDVDCNAGPQGILGPDDICRIQCNVNTILNIGDIHCHSAGTCRLECTHGTCFKSRTLNATNSLNLEVYASGDECIASSQFYLPNGGNASILVNTEGLTNHNNIADAAKFYSQSTDHIWITCIDPRADIISDNECEDMDIYAADARFLSLTSIGAEMNGKTGNLEVHCPVNSDYTGPELAPCIVNMTNAMECDKIHIYANDGTPNDVMYYGCADNANVRIYCDPTNTQNDYPFTSSGLCWKTTAPTSDPTLIPTVTPTSNPITSCPYIISETFDSTLIINSDNCIIESCVFENIAGNAIEIESAQNITIRNCIIRNIQTHGIYLVSSHNIDNVLIESNNISMCGDEGIKIDSMNTNNIVIQNNSITDIGDNAIHFAGSGSGGFGNGGIVRDNYLFNVIDHGIRGSNNYNNLTVFRNVFTNDISNDSVRYQNNIRIHSTGFNIEGNMIFDANDYDSNVGESGVKAINVRSYGMIQGNIIYNVPYDGIKYNPSELAYDKTLIIQNNIIYNVGFRMSSSAIDLSKESTTYDANGTYNINKAVIRFNTLMVAINQRNVINIGGNNADWNNEIYGNILIIKNVTNTANFTSTNFITSPNNLTNTQCNLNVIINDPNEIGLNQNLLVSTSISPVYGYCNKFNLQFPEYDINGDIRGINNRIDVGADRSMFIPSFQPTSDPTIEPTINPSNNPTVNPTLYPTKYPTKYPTFNPTVVSYAPSQNPTMPTLKITTKKPTYKDGQSRETTNNIQQTNDNLNNDKKNSLSQLVLILVITCVVLLLCVAVLIGIVCRYKHRNKSKNNDTNMVDSIEMESPITETTLGGTLNRINSMSSGNSDAQSNVLISEPGTITTNKILTEIGDGEGEELYETDMNKQNNNIELETPGNITSGGDITNNGANVEQDGNSGSDDDDTAGMYGKNENNVTKCINNDDNDDNIDGMYDNSNNKITSGNEAV